MINDLYTFAFSYDINDIPKLPTGTGEAIILPGFARRKYGDTFDLATAFKGVYYSEDSIAYDNFMLHSEREIKHFAATLGYKVEVSQTMFGDVQVTNLGFSFNMLVKSKLSELKEAIELSEEFEDEEPTVYIISSGRHGSERSNIYNVAREKGLSVTPVLNGNDWEVRPQVKKTINNHKTKTNGNIGVMGAIDAWVATLDYDTPTTPPSELTSACTDSYFRTVLNKSTLLLTYRRGLVTKHEYLVRKRNGVWEVLLPTGVIGESPSYDVSLFNLWLMPYGYNIEE